MGHCKNLCNKRIWPFYGFPFPQEREILHSYLLKISIFYRTEEFCIPISHMKPRSILSRIDFLFWRTCYMKNGTAGCMENWNIFSSISQMRSFKDFCVALTKMESYFFVKNSSFPASPHPKCFCFSWICGKLISVSPRGKLEIYLYGQIMELDISAQVENTSHGHAHQRAQGGHAPPTFSENPCIWGKF